MVLLDEEIAPPLELDALQAGREAVPSDGEAPDIDVHLEHAPAVFLEQGTDGLDRADLDLRVVTRQEHGLPERHGGRTLQGIAGLYASGKRLKRDRSLGHRIPSARMQGVPSPTLCLRLARVKRAHA